MNDTQASAAAPRDHGGDLSAAAARYGGPLWQWRDLSTGVNPQPYRFGPIPAWAWARLPDAAAAAALTAAARAAYGAAVDPVIAPGAQALIQLAPRLRAPGRVGVVAPTYNEHAACFAAEGWQVVPIDEPEQGAGMDALVVVNPNNPDGRRWAPERLLALADGRLMVVDESFADPEPALSLAAQAGRPGLLILRSFGKFYGLAGLRLGFALTEPGFAARLTGWLGPWAVSGPALAVGAEALANPRWAEATRARLTADAARLDALAAAGGWRLVGGTPLFRTYDTPDARAARDRLAAARLWTRAFPWSAGWLRMGLPGDGETWDRVAAALDKRW